MSTYLVSLSGRQGRGGGRQVGVTAAASLHLLEREVDALVLAPNTTNKNNKSGEGDWTKTLNIHSKTSESSVHGNEKNNT